MVVVSQYHFERINTFCGKKLLEPVRPWQADGSRMARSDTDKATDCPSVPKDVLGLFYNFPGWVIAAESATNKLFLGLTFLANINPLEVPWGGGRGPSGFPNLTIRTFKVPDSI